MAAAIKYCFNLMDYKPEIVTFEPGLPSHQ